jgi:hypothetical protein
MTSLQEKARSFASAMGIGDLQTTVLLARQRQGNAGIGTQVKQGKFRVVRITYGKTTRITPLSAWQSMADTIRVLRAL